MSRIDDNRVLADEVGTEAESIDDVLVDVREGSAVVRVPEHDYSFDSSCY